jgi:hypothetical protein
MTTFLYVHLTRVIDRAFFGRNDATLRAGETAFKRSKDYSFGTLTH